MKNILFIVITMAIMSCMLVGCEEKESNTYKDESDTQQSAALVDINNNLSYDNSTRIVYWYFEDGAGRTSTGFMSPYISKDGRYCRYEKGKIVPVERCKYCNRLLFNEDVGREYIQINSDMKIQSKFICLKCEMELRKEDFFEPYRSMMK